MQIAFNNGAVYDIPIIEFGTPDTSLTVPGYHYTNTPFFYYARGSAAGIFGVLDDFVDAVDALGTSYSRPYTPYSICTTLSAVDWHTPDYFEPGGEGYDLIQDILAHVVWIVGSYSEGGVGMCKIGSKYGFIGWDGVLTSDDGTYKIYKFSSSAYELSGDWYGVFSKTELQHATVAWHTNVDQDTPPLYVFYEQEGYDFGYNEEFVWNSGAVGYWDSWTTGRAEEAMNNSNWIGTTLGSVYIPERPFKPKEEGGGYVTNKCYYKIAESYGREGYNSDGRDIYGGSEVDDDDDPFSHTGYNSNSGGGGDWDGNSDQGGWTKDDQFATDALNSGFFTLYNPTKGEMQAFNDYLFSDITEAIATQLKKLIADPIDYVLFLAMVHYTPSVENTKQAIKFVGLDSGVTSNVVKSQMHKIDCGTVFIEEQRETKSFLSYDPYFKCSLYLPYIGSVTLSIDDVMNCYVTIRYWIDQLSGACIAQIMSKRTTKRCDSDILNTEGICIGEYTGNCFEQLPITATDWRGLFSSILGAVGGTFDMMRGNIGQGAASMAQAVMADKVSTKRAGQLGANHGYLGYQKPYFIFERPNPAVAGDVLGKGNKSSYGGFQGWTCNIIKQLQKFDGYTEIRPECLWTDEIDGITEEETAELKSIFSTGVYLNWS